MEKIRNIGPMIMVQKAEIMYKDERCKEEEYKELVEALYKFFNNNLDYFGAFLKKSRHNAYRMMLNEYEEEAFDFRNEEILKAKIKEVLLFIDIAKAIAESERGKNDE